MPTKSSKSSTGGTPIGWSFYSTALECWRRWYLRYFEGWLQIKGNTYQPLGTAYHALQEGRTPKEIIAMGPEYVIALPQAKQLYEARQSGPKLYPAKAIEKTIIVADGPLAGIFSSKPDRIELDGKKTIVRDFKTAKRLYDNDQDKWDVNGEIIGEMLAAHASEAVVDIVTTGDVHPKVRVIRVGMTPEKKAAFERLILAVFAQVTVNSKALYAGTEPEVVCPRNLNHCAFPVRCQYYDWCWGGGALARAMFTQKREMTVGWQKLLLKKYGR